MSFSLLLRVSFLPVYREKPKILDAFPKARVTSMAIEGAIPRVKALLVESLVLMVDYVLSNRQNHNIYLLP